MRASIASAEVVYGQLHSPLGPLALAASGEGMVGLAFQGAEPFEATVGRLSVRLPAALSGTSTHGSDDEARQMLVHARHRLAEYFAGSRNELGLPVDWSVASGFTREVLEATVGVGYGTLTTYSALAAAVGRPGAARAVGNALGANPVAVVVPCHRVVRSDGSLGGYTSGQSTKSFLLRLEGSRMARTSR